MLDAGWLMTGRMLRRSPSDKMLDYGWRSFVRVKDDADGVSESMHNDGSNHGNKDSTI